MYKVDRDRIRLVILQDEAEFSIGHRARDLIGEYIRHADPDDCGIDRGLGC